MYYCRLCVECSQAVLDKKVTVQTKDVNPVDYIREAGIDLSLVLPAPDGIFVAGDIWVIPCQINQFFAYLRDPPISMKFGILADNAK